MVTEVRGGCLVEFDSGFTGHLAGVVVPGPETHIGWQAYDFVKRRLEGTRVAVFTWTTDNAAAGIVYRDDGLAFATIVYGAMLSGKDAGSDIAAELLALGFGEVDVERLPQSHQHYLDIEEQAREKEIGLCAPACEVSP